MNVCAICEFWYVAMGTSVVPHGTVLGPLLFIIIMGDSNRGISSSSIVSLADDTRL